MYLKYLSKINDFIKTLVSPEPKGPQKSYAPVWKALGLGYISCFMSVYCISTSLLMNMRFCRRCQKRL